MNKIKKYRVILAVGLIVVSIIGVFFAWGFHKHHKLLILIQSETFEHNYINGYHFYLLKNGKKPNWIIDFTSEEYDQWGNKVIMEQSEKLVVFRSKGPDSEIDTDDDMEVNYKLDYDHWAEYYHSNEKYVNNITLLKTSIKTSTPQSDKPQSRQ